MRLRLLSCLAISCLVVGCAGARPAPPPAAAAVHANGPAVDGDPETLREAGLVPEAIRCNRECRWGLLLRSDSAAGSDEVMKVVGPSLQPVSDEERERLRKEVQHVVMWRMVRSVLLDGNNNNLGAIVLKGHHYRDAAGVERPVIVFRSGLTPHPDQPGSCFRSLLEAGKVRHVVNLFDGDIPYEDLFAAEERAAKEASADYVVIGDAAGGYGPWRNWLRKQYDDLETRKKATDSVTRLIRDQILAPGGKAHRGNVHVHCGGGMHRTGIIFGLLERCVNGESMDVVEAHYKAHVAWQGVERPGGYEELNLRFVRDYDCSQLTR